MRTLLFYRRLAIVSKAVAGHRDTLTVNRNIPHAVNAWVDARARTKTEARRVLHGGEGIVENETWIWMVGNEMEGDVKKDHVEN